MFSGIHQLVVCVNIGIPCLPSSSTKSEFKGLNLHQNVQSPSFPTAQMIEALCSEVYTLAACINKRIACLYKLLLTTQRLEKRNHDLVPELAAYAPTQRFSHTSHHCGHNSSPPIAIYKLVEVTPACITITDNNMFTFFFRQE